MAKTNDQNAAANRRRRAKAHADSKARANAREAARNKVFNNPKATPAQKQAADRSRGIYAPLDMYTPKPRASRKPIPRI